jgi:hypothetical protein
LQPFVVHAIPSLQFSGVPATHPEREQVSTPLQTLLSLHSALFGVKTQTRLTSSQLLTVQATPSLQLGGVPATQPVAVHFSPAQKEQR